MSDFVSGTGSIDRLVSTSCSLGSTNKDPVEQLKRLTGVEVKPYIPSIPSSSIYGVRIPKFVVNSSADMSGLLLYFSGVKYGAKFEEISNRQLVFARVNVPFSSRAETAVPVELYVVGSVATDFLQNYAFKHVCG